MMPKVSSETYRFILTLSHRKGSESEKFEYLLTMVNTVFYR